MSDQRPQPTAALALNLQLVSRDLDNGDIFARDEDTIARFADTCWQAAARLVGYMETFDRDDTMVTIGDLKKWLVHYPDATVGDTIAAYLDQCIATEKTATNTRP